MKQFRAQTEAARRWQRRRLDLLGAEHGSRADVARSLGLSVRTLERYENVRAPAWYELALRGLAAVAGRERRYG